MAPPNTLFAVVASSAPDKLGAKIQEIFPDMNQNIAVGQWLIVAPSTMTTTEISQVLGITDGTNGSALILSSAGYFGRLNVSIWEWIKAKQLGGGANVSQPSS
jgi:hypothetical protein